MKYSIIFLLIMIQSACYRESNNEHALQIQIDNLEKQLKECYRPGFGEFMSGIQAHHAKLWFAGKNRNWKLADFEIHEIMEAIEDIQKYETDRKETKSIMMVLPPIDSVKEAIKMQNDALFIRSYTLLTNTCNNCHRSNEFEFNVIKIPQVNQFSNQAFSPTQRHLNDN